MLSSEMDAAVNNFDRIGDFTNFGRTEFLRKLRLDQNSRVLEIGNDSFSPNDETLIRGINTAPDLDLNEAGLDSSMENSDPNFSYSNVNNPRVPFGDAAFDTVISYFGVMFSTRPDRMITEINRVCRPGGTISLASWTPDGVIGQMFRLASRYAPFPGSWPFLWGRPAWVRTCFGEAISNVEFALCSVEMRFPFSVQTVVDLWLMYCQPLGAHSARLKPDQQTDLRLDLEWLLSAYNLSSDDTSTVVKAEYLNTHATRKQHRSPTCRLFRYDLTELNDCASKSIR